MKLYFIKVGKLYVSKSGINILTPNICEADFSKSLDYAQGTINYLGCGEIIEFELKKASE